MTLRLSGLIGAQRPTRAILNAWSAAGAATGGTAALREVSRQVLSGALAAATLKTVLSVTGAGECSALAAYAVDTTSRTVRLRISVDGTVVFDSTSAANTTAFNGLIATGGGGTFSLTAMPPIRFSASLVVEVASSLSETDKLGVAYALNTF